MPAQTLGDSVTRDASRLCRTPPPNTRGASYREGRKLREMVSPVESFLGDVARGLTTTCFWSIYGYFVV